jgi:hypothetical protein
MQPVIGQVSTKSIRVQKRNWYANPFRPVLVATLQAHENGTVISGKLAPAAFHRLFWRTWSIGVWLIGGLMFLEGLIMLFVPTSDHSSAH